MSLNTKKYWLDGIFDDEEYVVPKEDLKHLISEKSLSFTSPFVEEEILCRDYVYCENAGYCKNKAHIYRIKGQKAVKRLCYKVCLFPQFLDNQIIT